MASQHALALLGVSPIPDDVTEEQLRKARRIALALFFILGEEVSRFDTSDLVAARYRGSKRTFSLGGESAPFSAVPSLKSLGKFGRVPTVQPAQVYS